MSGCFQSEERERPLMHAITAIIIQAGLVFGPILLFLLLKSRKISRATSLFQALILSLLTGWCASFLASRYGWQPVMKSGKVLDISPWALFWILAGSILLILILLIFAKPAGTVLSQAGVAQDSAAGNRAWRVGHTGRDRMFYEEFRRGGWQRIEIDGEMLMGPAHHVIYFASPDKWEKYPEWARGRREEIIARIKSEFTPPDYEYYGA